MVPELALEDSDFESRAVSSFREMGVYEALWPSRTPRSSRCRCGLPGIRAASRRTSCPGRRGACLRGVREAAVRGSRGRAVRRAGARRGGVPREAARCDPSRRAALLPRPGGFDKLALGRHRGYPDAVARRARAHRAPEYALVAELLSSTKYSTEAHSRAAKSSRPPVFREPRSAGCSSPGGCPIWPPLRISTMQNFELSAGFRASGRNGNTYHFPSCCHTRIAVLALFLLAGAASAKTWRGPRRGTRAPLLALLTQRLPLFAIRGTAYRNRTWSGLRPLHGTLFRRPAGDRHRAHRRLVRSARQRALHRGRRNALALRLRPAQLDAGRSRREPQPEEALRCHAVDAVDEPLLVRGPCRRSVAQVRAADRRCAGGERLGSRALGLRVYRDDRPKLRGRSINHDSRGSTERAVFRHDRCLALVGRQRERTDYVPRAGPSRLPILMHDGDGVVYK